MTLKKLRDFDDIVMPGTLEYKMCKLIAKKRKIKMKMLLYYFYKLERLFDPLLMAIEMAEITGQDIDDVVDEIKQRSEKELKKHG